MELTATHVLLVVSVLIPFLTGLLTKVGASATIKQVVTLTLAAVNTVVVSNVGADGNAVLTDSVLLDAGVSWFIAVTTYLGVYKPHDANSKIVPNVGLGASTGRHTA